MDKRDAEILLNQMGPCPAGPGPRRGDLNGDGTVGILDLLVLVVSREVAVRRLAVVLLQMPRDRGPAGLGPQVGHDSEPVLD